MSSDPSNAAIMEAIGQLRGEVKTELSGLKEDLGEVKVQTKKTNGRVNRLELEMAKQTAADAAVEVALEKYKREKQDTMVVVNNPSPGSVQIQAPKWFQNEKLVAGVAALLLAVAAAISFFAGKAS